MQTGGEAYDFRECTVQARPAAFTQFARCEWSLAANTRSAILEWLPSALR